jgi:enterochelin esterase-like enzyme
VAHSSPWAAALPIALELDALLLAFFSALAAHNAGMSRQPEAFLLSLDFDAERATFIGQLLVTLFGALLASTVFRRRIAPLAGATLYFIFGYLLPFADQARHPTPGPAGLPRVLIPGALPRLELTLLALAVTAAALGALVGASYGQLVITPVLTLVRTLWQAVRRSATAGPAYRKLLASTLSLLVGAVVFWAAFNGLGSAGAILTGGLTTDLYQLVPGAQAGGPGGVAHGMVEQGTYSSPALGGMERKYEIYLPPSYAYAASERYPVVYLLHGSPGSPGDWFVHAHADQSEEALLAAHRMRETLLVTADGNGPVYRYSEWANSFDKRQRMEDAIAYDLVRYIDAHYRTIPDRADRIIAGLSEGGFGAVNIALHHPDIFGAAFSSGGYFTAAGPVFGSGPGGAIYRAYNSPVRYITTESGSAAAHSLTFVIAVGTNDGNYYTDGVAFAQVLQHFGANVHLFVDKGGHSWPIWGIQLGNALTVFEPPLPGASGAVSADVSMATTT